MNQKLRKAGFSFHQEISTDRMAAPVLYSRESRGSAEKKRPRTAVQDMGDGDEREGAAKEGGRKVGLNPGKRNIVAMVCERNEKLRYTSIQR